MSVEPSPGTLSRRTLLGGLGTAGAITSGTAVPATARRSSGAWSDTRPQAAPTLTYALVDPSDFRPVLSSAGWYLTAVFPANIGWPGNSSINWSSSQQDIANTVISAVDPAGQVRIRAGVSSTQVVIDVLGYFT